MPYWATIPVAALICFGVGFLFGLPALRLGGLYLALATFALAVAAPQVLKVQRARAWTGGAQGIALDKPDAPFGLPLSSDQWLYLFALAIAAVLFVLGAQSRARADRAGHDRDPRPAARRRGDGRDVAMLKTRTFAVSALYTGVAGSIGAIAVAFVAPDSFGVPVDLPFVGLVVGGLGFAGGAGVRRAVRAVHPQLATGSSARRRPARSMA